MIAFESLDKLDVGSIVRIAECKYGPTEYTNVKVLKEIAEEEFIEFNRREDPNFNNVNAYKESRKDHFYYLGSDD